MMRCGVDLTGLDQLLPDDGRLDALVWSWAQDEPSATGDCAIQRRETGRWEAASCTGKPPRRLPRARRRLAHNYTRDHLQEGRERNARGTVPSFAVPRTGYENALLREATPENVATTWLGYRLS